MAKKNTYISIGVAYFVWLMLIGASNGAQGEIGFGTPVPIESSAVQWWAKALADINDDGLLDVVVINDNANGGWLGWYETQPGSTSWTQHFIANQAPGGGAFAGGDLAVGDIDNDGDVDVLGPEHPGEFANAGAPTDVYWYENPSWTPHFIGQAPDFIKDMSLVDLNQDGKLDIATLCYESTTLTVFRQDSPTSWTPVQDITLTGLHEGMDTGDIDGDGDNDLSACGYWFESPGGDLTGTWTVRSIDEKWHNQTEGWQRNATKTICTDLNGDGRVEVFLSHSELPGYPVAWYSSLDPATGPWTEHVIRDGMAMVHTLQVADLDMDGYLDVLAGENAGQTQYEVRVFLNDGSHTNWDEFVVDDNGAYNGLLGDIEGDGDLDFWRLRGHSSSVFELMPNEGTLPTLSTLPLDLWTRHVIDPDMPWRAPVMLYNRDFNGDGLVDIGAGGFWYEYPGAIEDNWVRHPIGSPLSLAVVEDLDGDGDVDVLGTAGSESCCALLWAQNDGNGNFITYNNVDSGPDTPFMQGAVVDRFGPNGTGQLEVALQWEDNVGGTQLLTVPANPTVEQWTIRTISLTSQGEEVHSVDLDLDGDKDLYLGTRWLRNDGDTWTTLVVHPTTMTPDRNRLGDINGDGRLDAVVGNSIHDPQGRIVWYEQPGSSPEDLWTEHIINDTTIVFPQSLDLGDMDRDGDLDVIVGEHLPSPPFDALNVFVFENVNGLGTSWVQHTVYTGDEQHNGTQAFDYDGDGDLDIASMGWKNDKVVLYENLAINGSGNVPPPPLANNDFYSVEEGSSLVENASSGVLANDIDVDQAPLQAVLVDNVSNGVLNLNADGSFDYTPNPEFNGTDTFTYRATNGSEVSNLGTVTLTVIPVDDVDPPDPPSLDDFVAYGFEEVSGSAVEDVSGNGNNGLIVAPGVRNPNGYYGKAVEFGGAGGRVDIGGVDFPGNEVSVLFWFNADDFGIHDARFFSKTTGVQNNDHYLMVSTLSGSSQLRMRLKTVDGVTTTLLASNAALASGVWTHVAAVYDGSEMRLYKNGNLLNSIAKSGAIAQNPSVLASIGDNPFGGRSFDGRIDEFCVYTRALSVTEIQSKMSTPVGQSDDIPPITPDGLLADAIFETQVDLLWNPSSDNVGVAVYRIFRDDVLLATISQTSHSDTGLIANTTYQYTVAAVDFYGNESDLSAPLNVTTLAPDITQPTVPQNLMATAVSETRIDLSWDPSTDDRGVANYHIYRDGGLVGTTAFTFFNDTGLIPDTLYEYTVSAVDDVPNESALSTPASAQTLALTGNNPPEAVDDAVTTDEDSAVSITLQATDPDGDGLTYSILTDPSNGELSGTTPNVTYTPGLNFNGLDAFTFQVLDGKGGADTGIIDITVEPVNDPPIAQAQAVGTNGAIDITLVATDAEGDPLTYNISTQPGSGNLTGTPPNVTYTPDPEFTGEDSFTFIANDGQADSNEATVSIVANSIPPVFAHWPLDEGVGTTTVDASGNGHTGTLFNGPTWLAGPLLAFDGVDDYVDVGSFDVIGNAITLTAWIFSDDLANCSYNDCRIISKAVGTGASDHYWMLSTVRSGSNTRLRFRLKTEGVTSTLIASSGNLTANQWFHVAAVYDGSTMRLYKDGVEVGNLEKTGEITPNSNVGVWIGSNPPSATSRPWDGVIDEVRVYDRALAPEEIQALAEVVN